MFPSDKNVLFSPKNKTEMPVFIHDVIWLEIMKNADKGDAVVLQRTSGNKCEIIFR